MLSIGRTLGVEFLLYGTADSGNSEPMSALPKGFCIAGRPESCRCVSKTDLVFHISKAPYLFDRRSVLNPEIKFLLFGTADSENSGPLDDAMTHWEGFAHD